MVEITGRLLGRAIDLATTASALAVVLMMVHISVDVAGKYLFNAPLPATNAAISNYYMVAATFLPLAFAERLNQHISVEVVTEQMPQWLQRHLTALSLLFSAIVFALLTYASWNEAWTKHAVEAFIVEQGVRIPTWPSYYFLPAGCGLMTLTLVLKLIALVAGARIGLGETLPGASGPEPRV